MQDQTKQIQGKGSQFPENLDRFKRKLSYKMQIISQRENQIQNLEYRKHIGRVIGYKAYHVLHLDKGESAGLIIQRSMKNDISNEQKFSLQQ